MKKFLSYSLFLSGLFGVSAINAAQYTHRLTYTNTDNDLNAVLVADVIFNDAAPGGKAQSNTPLLGESVDTNFTTSITFRYTPTPGGTSYTISGDDITVYRLSLKSPGSMDYDGNPTLLSQLNNIQFGTLGATTSPSFTLTMNDESFELQANQGGSADDFDLASTAQFPAPLPLLGLIPAFSSISRLKKRYKLSLKK